MIRKIIMLWLLVFTCPFSFASQDGEDFDSALLKAKAGDVIAQTTVSRMYLDGMGVSQNMQQAQFWAYKAAEGGMGYGLFDLGRYYEGLQTPVGNQAAIHWYTKASELGMSDASLRLAGMYAGDYAGVKPDKKKEEYFDAKFMEQHDAERAKHEQAYTPPAKDPNDKPVPYKKGFYIDSFLGSKRGGAFAHEEIYQLIKASPDFSGVDIFCVKGIDPTASVSPEVIEEYKKNNPVPMLNEKCEGAASVSVGPFQSYELASQKMSILESRSGGNFFPSIIECDTSCKEAEAELKESSSLNRAVSNDNGSPIELSYIEKEGFKTYVNFHFDWESFCGEATFKSVKVFEHQESLEGLPKNSHVIGYKFACTKGKLSRVIYVGFVFVYKETPGAYTMYCIHYKEDKNLVLDPVEWESCGPNNNAAGSDSTAPEPAAAIETQAPAPAPETEAVIYAKNIASTINVNSELCTMFKDVILERGSSKNIYEHQKIYAIDKIFDKAYDKGCVIE